AATAATAAAAVAATTAAAVAVPAAATVGNDGRGQARKLADAVDGQGRIGGHDVSPLCSRSGSGSVRFHWHRVVTQPRGAGLGRVTTGCNNQPDMLLPAAATTTATAIAVPSAVPAAAADRHDSGAGFDLADAVGVQANVGGHETLPLPVLGDSLFHSPRHRRRGAGRFHSPGNYARQLRRQPRWQPRRQPRWQCRRQPPWATTVEVRFESSRTRLTVRVELTVNAGLLERWWEMD